jgi:ABC-type methionine transport system ATPase subunit
MDNPEPQGHRLTDSGHVWIALGGRDMIIEQKVRLIYPEHLRDQPLLYQLSHQFDLVTNILEARVTREESWLILAVRGELEQVQQGLDWIAERGVQVQMLERIEEEA